MGLISEECIFRNMRLSVPQCLQGGFLHAAAMEVALPFSSPSTHPRFSEEPPALLCKLLSDQLPFTCYPCDQEELQVDPDSDPISASHQGALCSTPIAVPYCFYKLVIPSPSEAVVSKEAKSRRHGIYA